MQSMLTDACLKEDLSATLKPEKDALVILKMTILIIIIIPDTSRYVSK